MPIYEYKANDDKEACYYCRKGFETLQKMSGDPLKVCPKCGAAITKQISTHSVGGSQSGLDDRAKSAGFTKLKRLGKGEYEKQY